MYKLNIESWVGWIVATATASFSMMTYIHSEFPSKDSLDQRLLHIDKRQDEQKKELEKYTDQIEKRLERLENKIDKILLRRK